MPGTISPSIEKINQCVYYAYLNIPEFIDRVLGGYVPSDYRTAGAIDLAVCRPVLKYCSTPELERVAGAKVLKRQVEWLCGRVVLKELLKSVMFPEKGFPEIIIGYDAAGRPCITGYENISVSVTHSGDVAMAALHTVPGKRVGIDVERTSGIDLNAVLSVAFSPEERMLYKDRSVKDIITFFTMKEAYLKVTGRGFHEVLTRVTVIDGKIFYNSGEVTGIRTVTGDHGDRYIFSLIYDL